MLNWYSYTHSLTHTHISRTYHRKLSTLKKSPQLSKQHNPASPSPIAEHRPHIPSQSRSRPAGETLVVYHLDEIPTPYAKRLGTTTEITLGDFKEKVFARNGEYRYVSMQCY